MLHWWSCERAGSPPVAIPGAPYRLAMGRARANALAALWIVAPAPSIGAAAAFLWAPGPLGKTVFAAAKLILYGTPLLWRFVVDRRPPSFSPARRGGLLVGFGLGILIGAAILGVYALWLRERIDPAPLRDLAAELGFATKGRFLLVGAWIVGINALLEEYAFRWFVYTRCRVLMRPTPAILLAAAVFTAHHVIILHAYFDGLFVLLGAAGVFTGGLIWTWCYRRYGSIWPGFLSHAIVDVAVLAVGWDLLFAG